MYVWLMNVIIKLMNYTFIHICYNSLYVYISSNKSFSDAS